MKNDFNCIIVDDEPNAIGLLKATLHDMYPNIAVSKSCTEWTEALKELKTNSFDILFLDISMPGKNGIDLLKLLPALNCEVIFTTAHQEYAIEAFKLSATGYILKPIEEEDLVKAVETALARVRMKEVIRLRSDKKEKHEIIGIPDNKGIDYVKMGDIICLEAYNKCTKVTTVNGELFSSYNIGKFKAILDDTIFCQIHRSYIININWVRKYLSLGNVILRNNIELPVSRNFKDDFLKMIATISKM